jgi:hypothetical protein
MATERDNEQRLRDAGVIRQVDLERPYEALVEGLTPDEVDVLIAVRKRIEEADRVFGWDPGSDEPPPSAHRLMPP